jgi:glucose-6-phosphate 1-dehydrogenase
LYGWRHAVSSTARSSASRSATGRSTSSRSARLHQGGETIDEDVFKRFAHRLSYVGGDFTDPRRTTRR